MHVTTYSDRVRQYIDNTPENERESARAQLVSAAEFLANELRVWRRQQKETGEPSHPPLDIRHRISLDIIFKAFGPQDK